MKEILTCHHGTKKTVNRTLASNKSPYWHTSVWMSPDILRVLSTIHPPLLPRILERHDQ